MAPRHNRGKLGWRDGTNSRCTTLHDYHRRDSAAKFDEGFGCQCHWPRNQMLMCSSRSLDVFYWMLTRLLWPVSSCRHALEAVMDTIVFIIFYFRRRPFVSAYLRRGMKGITMMSWVVREQETRPCSSDSNSSGFDREALFLDAGDWEYVEEGGKRAWTPDTPPELQRHDWRDQLARQVALDIPPRPRVDTSATFQGSLRINTAAASPSICNFVTPVALPLPSVCSVSRIRSARVVWSPRSSVCSPRFSPRASTVVGEFSARGDQSDRQNENTTAIADAARDSVLWGAAGSQCSLCGYTLENGQQVVMSPSCAEGMKV